MADAKTDRPHWLYTETRAQRKVRAIERQVAELETNVNIGWGRVTVYSRHRRGNRSRAIRRATTILNAADSLIRLLRQSQSEDSNGQ